MQVEDERTKSPFEKLKSSKIIAKLKGVKNIQIIIAILIIAVALIIYSNVLSKSGSKSSSTVGASVMTEEETRLSSVLAEIDGAGDVSAMITKNNGETVGVIVIAEGASDITVRLRLLDATATALGVDKQIVSVYSKSRG
ncbi:MAG: hypothetical protein J5815_01215 [Clostridia bacterium]|nr:hypothetical protein [Clostridia bacterium]